MDKSSWKLLEESILTGIPQLNNLEVGQRFHSEYYGTITATRITKYGKGVYSIYGFDEKDGSPRDCYYPRDLKMLGKDIMLDNVLSWHSQNGRNKYSHFEVSNFEAYFSIYDGEERADILWNLSKRLLKDQSEELIEWLTELI